MSRILAVEKKIRTHERDDLRSLPSILGIDSSDGKSILSRLPFSPKDITIGTESEYQTAVIGSASDVDLPVYIRESAYYMNLSRRVKSGDTAKRSFYLLEKFLEDNTEQVWENSWVRFPLSRLSTEAHGVFINDLKADKTNPLSGNRPDYDRYFFDKNGVKWIRIPASYVLKLALVDIFSVSLNKNDSSYSWILEHFLNDNSSPETFSFYPAGFRPLFSCARG